MKITMASNRTKKVEMVKTTFRIPKWLLDNYKHLAIDENTTVADLFVQALKARIELKK